MPHDPIPTRRFGRHPDLVSIIGLGGYHLGTIGTVKEALNVVHAAIDAGITFMDNAWDYHDGVSEIRMGKALKGRHTLPAHIGIFMRAHPPAFHPESGRPYHRRSSGPAINRRTVRWARSSAG